ncbi:enoyl-CoA hydratase/isomerase family protein [Halorarius litoreus]|uniref:enoyl-CoA hydratase/isomerase family protein n=1 Tax=Halorarius litoreus TaxID=2962676 RepID=UPI0020CDFCE6|nr:enoyl-CoA hydratase-related protein [Halorarius litoreus]
MTDEPVHVDREEGVGTITLDRPETNNSMDAATAEALRAAAVDLASDDDVRCIVLTGSGATFNTGADLSALNADAGDESTIRTIAARLHEFVSQLARADKPVVCGVNGVVAGGGIGPSLCGDIVLASESARWEFAYPRIGLSADGGSSYFLPRLVGLRTAQEIAFRDEPVGAAEAADMGLATEVVPDDEFDDRLWAEAERLANGPTLAYAETRELLRTSFDRGLESHLAEEAERIAGLTATDDFAEGIDAFFAKGEPDFQGH